MLLTLMRLMSSNRTTRGNVAEFNVKAPGMDWNAYFKSAGVA